MKTTHDWPRTITIPKHGFPDQIGSYFSSMTVGFSVDSSKVSLICTSLVFKTALLLDSSLNSFERKKISPRIIQIPVERIDWPWLKVHIWCFCVHSCSIRSTSAPVAPLVSAAAKASARATDPLVVVPKINSWSVMSTFEDRSLPDSASVRAINSMVDFSKSSWKRDATKRETWVEVGTRTFPPRCPHLAQFC